MSEFEDKDSRIVSTYQTNLPSPPSCIEFSPRLTNVFVVGTYSLHEREESGNDLNNETSSKKEDDEAQSRAGSLLLFHLNPDSTVDLKESYSTDSAVLDLHFSPHDPNLLATATSTGLILLDHLDPAGDTLERCRSIQAFEHSILILSLAWCPDPIKKDLIAVTLSSGAVALVECPLHSTQAEPPHRLFEAHSLEAWTVAWSWDSLRIYSGGDDSAIRTWNPHFVSDKPHEEEARLPADEQLERYLRKGPPLISIPGTKTDLRSHTAGVTAVLPLRVDGDLDVIVTGSYDETLRILRPRSGRTWQLLAELNLGGGVWRIKLLQSKSSGEAFTATVLASCMHAGSRIVEITEQDDDWTLRVVARFDEHQSMNYGSDAVLDRDPGHTIVSTSFYDRLLCVWRS